MGGSALLSGLITFKGLRIPITFITAKNFFFSKAGNACHFLGIP